MICKHVSNGGVDSGAVHTLRDANQVERKRFISHVQRTRVGEDESIGAVANNSRLKSFWEFFCSHFEKWNKKGWLLLNWTRPKMCSGWLSIFANIFSRYSLQHDTNIPREATFFCVAEFIEINWETLCLVFTARTAARIKHLFDKIRWNSAMNVANLPHWIFDSCHEVGVGKIGSVVAWFQVDLLHQILPAVGHRWHNFLLAMTIIVISFSASKLIL